MKKPFCNAEPFRRSHVIRQISGILQHFHTYSCYHVPVNKLPWKRGFTATEFLVVAVKLVISRCHFRTSRKVSIRLEKDYGIVSMIEHETIK